TEAELIGWFGNGANRGLAAVGGPISGNLEILDFDVDAKAILPEWKQLVGEALGESWLDRIVINRTPRPGFQIVYRCQTVSGNTKLAKRANPNYDPNKKTDSKTNPKELTLIETRGRGGYFLLPGCPAECHETERLYEWDQHDASSIPEITPEEREI